MNNTLDKIKHGTSFLIPLFGLIGAASLFALVYFS